MNISIHLPKHVEPRVREAAAELHVSRSRFIQMAIEAYLSKPPSDASARTQTGWPVRLVQWGLQSEPVEDSIDWQGIRVDMNDPTSFRAVELE